MLMTKSKFFLAGEIAFLAGIFLANFVAFDKMVIIIAAGLLLAIALVSKLTTSTLRVEVVLVTAVCGILIFAGIYYFNWYKTTAAPTDISYGGNISAIAIVCDEPVIKDKSTQLKILIKESNFSKLGDTKTLVSVPNYPAYNYGDLIKLDGKITAIQQFDTFDYAAYLNRYQIFYIIQNPSVELISVNQGSKFFAGIYKIKSKMIGNANKIFHEPIASFFAGLILGARKNIPETLMAAFNTTGTTHIIAISGANIAIIVIYLQILMQYWPRKLSAVITFLFLITFCILTGLSASVIRAALLASIIIIAKMLGRLSNGGLALIFAGCIMVVQNPLILVNDVGFQLSFLAMFGIIYLNPIFVRIMNKIPHMLSEIIASTISAQIFTFPILIESFSRISIISPIVNLLILPIVQYATIFGLVLAIVSLISFGLANIIGLALWFLLKYIIIVVEFFARFPFASINIENKFNYLVFLYYLILLIAIKTIYAKIKKINQTNESKI